MARSHFKNADGTRIQLVQTGKNLSLAIMEDGVDIDGATWFDFTQATFRRFTDSLVAAAKDLP